MTRVTRTCLACILDFKAMSHWRHTGGRMPKKTCTTDHRVKCKKCPVLHDTGRDLCDDCFEKDLKENPKTYAPKRKRINSLDLLRGEYKPPQLSGFLSQFNKKGK